MSESSVNMVPEAARAEPKQGPAPANIPYFRPEVDDDELELVRSSLTSGWLTSGPRVSEFEQLFAARVGAPYAVALNSATAALHLALLAHNVGPGDQVIVPTMTFAATAEVVLAVGAELVLVDCEPETLQIDVAATREAVTERTRAIMPVHYGGSVCDMDSLLSIREQFPEIAIVEDAAHAFPTRDPQLGMVGSIGNATCFSFYANKTITTGEGGMLTTASEEVAEQVRSLSLHGLSGNAWRRFETRAPWDYDIVQPGWKYNMTDSAASLGIGQLSRADAFAERRREIHRAYDEAFTGVSGLQPRVVGELADQSSHLYVLKLETSSNDHRRNELIRFLNERGIGTSVHYRPLHMHSYYRESRGYQPSDYPNAARLFEQIVSLPIFPAMRDDDVKVVIESVLEFVNNA